MHSSNKRRLFRLALLNHEVNKAVREGWYQRVRSPADHLLWTLWDQGYPFSKHWLSRRNVIAHLPAETLLNVSPAHIEHFVSFENRRAQRCFVWGGNWEKKAKHVRTHPRYQLMEDALRYRDDLRNSPTFQAFMKRSHEGSPKAIANKGLLLDSEERIEDFMRQQLALLDSIAENGIQPERAVDEMNVAVGSEGSLYKVNAGRKRTMAAKLLGLRTIPVRITQVHPDWLARFSERGELPRSRRLVNALVEVRARYEVDSTAAR